MKYMYFTLQKNLSLLLLLLLLLTLQKDLLDPLSVAVIAAANKQVSMAISGKEVRVA